MNEKYIPIAKKHIKQLEKQNCYCENWKDVIVSPAFKADNIRNVVFSGKIQLGYFDKVITFYGGVKKPSGIYNAHLHNCIVGDNVYIANVSNHIANYVIESDCIIDHIDLLAVEGKTAFGNGVKAVVINEGGGREIPIYDNLTAQIAYIIALYRHRPAVLEKLEKFIAQYAESVKSDMGIICKGAYLSNCGTIKNVKIGPFAIIGNVKRLENGTIKSCSESQTEVGASVVAKDFIIAEGARISEGSIISDCFIGQAVKMTKQFSAENSVCFANCGLHHGEICSIFAGPYTVSHHKSTLLIAGLFSFFNAGSGTNESNHMYKVGPVHQGIFDRGAKMTSDGYVMYPARIGPFCVVLGRHYAHPDTSDLPFSYLYEEEDKTYIIPGVNLRTVGIVRDGEKWPKRDERRCPDKTDLIIFDVLSPYTVEKIIKGLDLLLNLKPANMDTTEVVCNNLHFKTDMLIRGIEYYTLAINKFLGDCLMQKLKAVNPASIDDIKNIFQSATADQGKWIDVAGLLTPQNFINQMMDDVETDKLSSMEDVLNFLKSLYSKYDEFKWQWACEKIRNMMKGQSSDKEKIVQLINNWQSACEKLNTLIAADAKKEFGNIPKIGYGIDGDEKIRDLDFAAVRGTFDDNSFVREIRQAQSETAQIANYWIEKIKSL